MADSPTPPALVADCSSCFALCCVLLPFQAASGFGIDKPGGTPCPHLAADDRCSIHATLREDGWPGCSVFECFGAGQQVSQVTYGGVSWREQDNLPEMAAVLSVMRLLHEMLAHLGEVGRRTPDEDAAALEAEIVHLTAASPAELLGVDVDELQPRVGAVLDAAAARLRGGSGTSYRRQDLAGRDLRPWLLRDADLRGSLLIRADLRGQDLGRADLLGADLRDADLRGTDLSEALFVGQPQLNGAHGDASTSLPGHLRRPGHWESGSGVRPSSP
ncbi:pentapeptide repeat-containing protein [Nocardioides cynanchi]|uniref:pentapeptide repeat-containing protein n=1 Tax=Nocardioides cynanchi TaxID=2558918 RepID=UPI001245C22B|nr:pentapeptide repeat-containing protein [Nocardioides cynanchi]